MPVAATSYEHIVIDDRGVPVIAGANTKVVEVVGLARSHHLHPDEIREQLPHLTLGQIHSALAYYWDHLEEVDADIARRDAEVDRLRDELDEAPALVAKLRDRGAL
jgi:uncharacterized protein (DUF433 family)